MGQRVTIYTDGSCHGNPGPGGYAAVVFENGMTREVHGSDFYATNNRMELKAVIEGLRLLNEASKVKIITDSKYVANTINRGNLRAYANTPNRANADMWQEIAKLSEWHTLSAEWVKGHSGNRFNQRCDSLANAEASRVEQERHTRQIVFKELLMDITISAKEISHKHNLSLNTVEKYYRQYLDKYSVGGV